MYHLILTDDYCIIKLNDIQNEDNNHEETMFMAHKEQVSYCYTFMIY